MTVKVKGFDLKFINVGAVHVSKCHVGSVWRLHEDLLNSYTGLGGLIRRFAWFWAHMGQLVVY